MGDRAAPKAVLELLLRSDQTARRPCRAELRPRDMATTARDALKETAAATDSGRGINWLFNER
jgi:hypothetical protein